MHYTDYRPFWQALASHFEEHMPLSYQIYASALFCFAYYRTWEQKVVAEIAVDLHLAHIYGKGWQAGLRFPGARAVMFEPEIDQLFLAPETALETLLAFCSEQESVRKLAQRLAETHAQDRIVLRHTKPI